MPQKVSDYDNPWGNRSGDPVWIWSGDGNDAADNHDAVLFRYEFSTSSENWSFTVDSSDALTDGSYSLKAKATDAAGNVSNASPALTISIDTAAPAAPSTPDMAPSSDTGSSNSDNITGIRTPTFTGTAESGSTVELFAGSSLLGSTTADGSGHWSFTVGSDLPIGRHTIVSKASDAAGNQSSLSNALIIDILPMIDSVTYNSASGVLQVTGSGFVAKSGSANDIDVSKLSITGEGGNRYTLTSADVEVSSSSQFSVTLNATDQLHVGGLLNKNGSSSDGGTTYNLSAADDWVPGATASLDISDSSNGITVSNVSNPTLSSAAYDAASGALTVTGTNFVKKNGSSNDIDVSKLAISSLNQDFVLRLDGSGDYAETADNISALNITGDITVEATIKLNQRSGDWVRLVGNSSSSRNRTYGLWLRSDGAILFQQYGRSSVSLETVYKVPVGEQVHIAATRDAQSGLVRIFIDGELSAETTVASNLTPYSSNGPLRIGYAGYHTYFNGDIQDVSVWNVARSQSDIQANHIVGNESGLVAYYPVISASGNSIENKSTVSGLTANLFGNATKVSVPNDSGDAVSYTLTSGDVEVDSNDSFRVTLNAVDQLNVGGLLNKDGTTSDDGAIYNLAASDNWLTGAAASSDISDVSGNGITTSNVPLPTISGATYDASSGVLTVTGANFVKKFGSDNDIDVSKLSVARAGGRSYSLTSPDIELSSDTTFTVDLNDADQLKLSRLLNKNGMYSRAGTLYSFAAADGWLQGAAASEDISVSSNSLTVSNVAPVFTSGFNASSLDEQSGARQVVYKANAVHDATLTYSLKANDGDASAFEINASTGDVTLIANPDYEANTLYSFTVIASDASGSSAERSVSLKIHNLDDTSPIFTSSSSPPPVDENLGGGQIVYTAEVADDSTVTYRLKENAGDAALSSVLTHHQGRLS